MTTSVSSEETSLAVAESAAPPAQPIPREHGVYRIRHTLASRFAFLVICVAIVLSALAYGTVHYWALGLFNLGGLTILVLWVADAWRLGNLRVSRNLAATAAHWRPGTRHHSDFATGTTWTNFARSEFDAPRAGPTRNAADLFFGDACLYRYAASSSLDGADDHDLWFLSGAVSD